jgi:hypothetical protein
MSTREANNDSHLSNVPRVVFSSQGQQSIVHFSTQSDSTAGSSNRHNNSPCGSAASVLHDDVNCSILDTSRASVSIADKFISASSYQFIGRSSPDEAATVGKSPHLPAPVAAAIPEAGPCGFAFDSYDRLNNEHWGE